jgi:tagatose 6-phosphate kinase
VSPAGAARPATILTVALNLALDVTYFVERVEWHAGNRVARVHEQAGGKGVNVARVLQALGHEPVVTGLAGGTSGDAARADLAAAGLREALLPIAAATRRTVAVVDETHGDATGFWEPGPTVDAHEWADFVAAFPALVRDRAAVVLTGSLPGGVPLDAYAQLGSAAARLGVPVVLDADGEALRHGLGARPAVVKPNAGELARAAPGLDAPAAAAWLRAAGAGAVVASRGPDGLLAVTPDGSWRVRLAERVDGNPTGAGDAAVAALAAGIVAGWSWPERLRHAVALSAAAVHSPVAGAFAADAYRRYLPAVSIERLDGVHGLLS